MIYSQTAPAKTGTLIPLFTNGKPMHSRYNPESEADNFISGIEDGFIIICGTGSGIHIKKLAERNSQNFIIAIEEDDESLNFCMQFPSVKDAAAKNNVRLCTKKNYLEVLSSSYLPVKYLHFSFNAVRSWENENQQSVKELHYVTEKYIKAAGADYSVQSHFGKIWHHNIICNSSVSFSWQNNADTSKTALICAAGPSLEDSLSLLKNNRNAFYVIAADTSFGTLISSDIIPDVVVSVDAQKVSTEHFLCCPDRANSCQILFLLDVSSNPVLGKFLESKGHKIVYFRGAHPLACNLYRDSLLELNSLSGTVTACCTDFAIKSGFKKIQFAGADYSYIKGMPYARGTYLEKSFHSGASRLSTAEQSYCSIMYRTELKPAVNRTNGVTSEVMENYRTSIENFLNENSFTKTDSETYINENNTGRINGTFTFSGFKKIDSEKLSDFSYYPLCAWIRKNQQHSDTNFDQILKLAHQYTLRYNKKI